MEDYKLPILIIDYDRRYLVTELANSVVQVFFETSATSNRDFVGLLKGLFLPCYGITEHVGGPNHESVPDWVHKCEKPRDIRWYQFIINEVSKRFEHVSELEVSKTLFFLGYFKSWEQIQITAQYNTTSIHPTNNLIGIILEYALEFNLILDQSSNYKLVPLNECDKLPRIDLSTIRKKETSNFIFHNEKEKILQAKNPMRGDRVGNLQKNYEASTEAEILTKQIDPAFKLSVEYQKEYLNELLQLYGFNKEIALIKQKYLKYKNKYYLNK